MDTVEILQTFRGKVSQLRDAWLPRTVIRLLGDDVRVFRYRDGRWLAESDPIESPEMFEQRVLLIPDRLTFHQLRHFPADAVSKGDLKEAVELDLARWAPWSSQECTFYFWPRKSGDQWQVAVWVWRQADIDEVLESKGASAMYILPERAWKLAALNAGQHKQGLILIDRIAETTWVYTGMTGDFSTLTVNEVREEKDAMRFRRSLGPDGVALPVYVDPDVDIESLYWEAGKELLPATYALPDRTALASGRQQGVSDYEDPFTWFKPVAVLLGLYIFWLVGSGLVALRHSADIAAYMGSAGELSTEVLDAREDVERLNLRLRAIDVLNRQQSDFMKALAELSTTLPANAWLSHVEFRSDAGGWLEITGESEESAALAAILEQMPRVSQATFVNAIRKDPLTGMEPFKIRLKLELQPESEDG